MKPVRKSLVGLSLLAPAAVLAKDDKPNIVFFLVDDMGWVDSSVAYGEEVYPNNLRFHTPNMDRLAREGVILTSAYACPVSTPTRTSLLTGMNAAHTGITNWTSTMRDTPSDATGGAVAMETGQIEENTGDRLIRPEWNINGMSPAPGVAHTQYATPLPQLLKDAGYFTIHVGKAHWASAGTPGASPYNMGFVVNVSGNVAGMPRSYQSEENYGNTPEKWNMLAVQNMTEYYGTGVHLTEALTREALKTLEYPIRHGEPFFLYMAHYATHTPIQPDKRFIQKYLDAGMDKGQARYASMVEGVDKSLGDLLDYLKEMGVEKNTVVVFMTDNGGNSENKQKGGVLHTQNKPLREGKGSCYEGGVRVPLMFRWPGRVAPNTREYARDRRRPLPDAPRSGRRAQSARRAGGGRRESGETGHEGFRDRGEGCGPGRDRIAGGGQPAGDPRRGVGPRSRTGAGAALSPQVEALRSGGHRLPERRAQGGLETRLPDADRRTGTLRPVDRSGRAA